MGNSVSWCSCLSKNGNDSGEHEAKLSRPLSMEIPKIIQIQSLIRGFIDRKKAVQYTKIKYLKKAKHRSKNVIKKSQ